MNEIIKKGSAQWYIIEKKGTFLQNDNSFKSTLTDVAKFTEISGANYAAMATNGTVKTLEITEFKIY